MSELSYRQLHQVSCGSAATLSRLSLIDYSAYGYICCAISEGILLYNISRYLKASGASNLRRDKALSDYYPDVRIKSADPVSWIAFNSDGLFLAVVTSNASQGTFVNLVHLNDALKDSCSDLAAVCCSLRVCGGEPLSSDGQPGWELRDFGWSPAAPTTFAVILRCGAVRLFRATPHPSDETPQTLVNQLPSSIGALCLSWSGKGKQLAFCLGGTLSTHSGVIQGPMILQVDPELHMKRVIQLSPTLPNYFPNSTSLTPLDLLWITPACFILGLHRVSATGESEVHAVSVHAPLKSTEVTCAEISDLHGRPTSTNHLQYYFHAVGSGHFLASYSAGGEEFVLFAVPSVSANVPLSSPSSLLTIELPPDGSPLGFSLGYFKENHTDQNVSYFLVSRLTNGCFSPYLLHNFDTIAPPPSLLPTPLDPPSPLISQPPDQRSTAPTPCSLSTQPVISEEHTQPTYTSNLSDAQIKTQSPLLFSFGKTSQSGGTLSSTTASPGLTNAFNLTFSNSLATSPPMSGTSDSMKTTSLTGSVIPAAPSKEHPTVTFPKSVQIASTQFTEALQSEAEAGRNAWLDLFDLLKNGLHPADTKNPIPTGVDAIETKLLDSESFLNALDKVLSQLQEGLVERKRDLTNCVEYTDKLRRSLLMCAGGDFAPLLVDQLDPQAARWLARLKRKARLVESSLLDMDTQLETLSAEVESRTTGATSRVSGSRVDSRHFYLAEDKPTSANKFLRVLDTVSDLIRTERGRVEYITENLKRLNLLSANDKRATHSSFISTPRSKAHRRQTDDCTPINPAYQHLSDRDRFLYKLFANHKVSTVYPPKVCPTLDDKVVDSSVTENEVKQSLDPQPITFQRGQFTDPRQLKLEKALESSGAAASTDSRIKETTILPDSKPQLPVSAGKSPSIHLTTPSGDIHVSSPSNQPWSLKPIVPVCSASRTPSSTFGTFVLGQKAAFTPPSGSDTATSLPSDGTTVTQEAATSQSVSSNLHASEQPTTMQKAPSSITPVFNFGSPSMRTSTTTDVTYIPPLSKPTSAATVVTTTSFVASSVLPTIPTTAFNAPPVSFSFTPVTLVSTTVCSAPVVSVSATEISTTKGTTGLFGTPTSGFSFGGNLFGPVSTSNLSTAVTTSNTITGGLFSFSQSTQPSGGLFGQSLSLFGSTNTAEPKTSVIVSGTTSVSSSLPTFTGLFSSTVIAPSTCAPSSPVTCAPGTSLAGSAGPIASPITATTVSSTATSLLFSNSSASTALTFGIPKSTVAPLTVFTTSPSSVAAAATTDSTSSNKSVLDFRPGVQTTPSTSTAVFGGFFGTLATTAPLTFGTVTTASLPSSGFTFKLPATSSSTTTVSSVFPAVPTTTAPIATTSQVFTNLFGAPTSSIAGFGGSLFGSTSSNLTFSAPATTVSTNTGANLFQVSSATSPFGQGASLFGQKTTGPGASPLFGVPPVSTVPATTTTPSAFTGGGLFSGLPTAQQPTASGLFGSTGTTKPTDVSNLFSASSFGLGATSPSTQTQGQNVFGRPFAASGFGAGSQTGAGLFSGTTPTPQSGGGLFGAPVLASNQPTTGGLFGSQQNPVVTGGLFGTLPTQPSSPLSAGGFGSRPVFGNTPFGIANNTQPAFGTAGVAAFGAPAVGGIFGGGSSTLTAPAASGATLFGTSNPTASVSGGGLFAALAAKTDSPTFGSLAMGSPAGATPSVPASPFGASPSFTQRRA